MYEVFVPLGAHPCAALHLPYTVSKGWIRPRLEAHPLAEPGPTGLTILTALPQGWTRMYQPWGHNRDGSRHAS
jgi:hypothetical protein